MNTDPLIFALEKLHLTDAEITPIQHGDTISSQVYFLRKEQGRSMVLKLFFHFSSWEREKRAYDRLSGVIPLPKVIEWVPPTDSFHGALLMEQVDGILGSHLSITSSMARQMGEILARLHTVSEEQYSVGENGAEWLEHKLMDSIKECSNVLLPSDIEACLSVFEKSLPLLNQADGPRLVHRDYRQGNILFHEGDIAAILDFEHTQATFAEKDFAQVALFLWSKEPQTKAPFLEGYRSVRPLPSFEEVLPLLLIVKTLGVIGFTVKRQTYLDQHREIFLKNRAFLQQLLSIPNFEF